MGHAIALGNLGYNPPCWLVDNLDAEEIHRIGQSKSTRRASELVWSRCLLRELLESRAQIDSGNSGGNIPIGPELSSCTSVTHDRYLTAVVVSDSNEIGIDLQSARNIDSCIRISQTWFPAREAEEIYKKAEAALDSNTYN